MQLILGPAFSGKTAALLEQVRRGMAQGRRQIWMTPEFLSHLTERRLARELGAGSAMLTEVLGFERLAHRVFSRVGGLAEPYLDNGGRLLLLRQAAVRARPALRQYAQLAARPEQLARMLESLDEMRCYRVSAEQLWQAAEGSEGLLRQKLQDVSLLCAGYDNLCGGEWRDPGTNWTSWPSACPRAAILWAHRCILTGFPVSRPRNMP